MASASFSASAPFCNGGSEYGAWPGDGSGRSRGERTCSVASTTLRCFSLKSRICVGAMIRLTPKSFRYSEKRLTSAMVNGGYGGMRTMPRSKERRRSLSMSRSRETNRPSLPPVIGSASNSSTKPRPPRIWSADTAPLASRSLSRQMEACGNEAFSRCKAGIMTRLSPKRQFEMMRIFWGERDIRDEKDGRDSWIGAMGVVSGTRRRRRLAFRRRNPRPAAGLFCRW